MKFSKLGRIALASVVTLGLGFGVTACGPSNTIDFLYVTSSQQNPGQINVYKVDSEAGALIPIPDLASVSGARHTEWIPDGIAPTGCQYCAHGELCIRDMKFVDSIDIALAT